MKTPKTPTKRRKAPRAKGTPKAPVDPAASVRAHIEEAQRLCASVTAGVERLTAPGAELHREFGKGVLMMIVAAAPRVIGAVRGGIRGFRAPDREAHRRAKQLAKDWAL